MRLISSAIAAIETNRGAKWTEDPSILQEAQVLAAKVFEMYSLVLGKGPARATHSREWDTLIRLDLLAAILVSSEMSPGKEPEELLEQAKSLVDRVITDRGRRALDG